MSRPKINRYEVLRSKEWKDWEIVNVTESRGGYIVNIEDTRAEAVSRARVVARGNPPSQLRVRDLKGRWKVEASYGVDSRRRKG